MRFWLIHFFFKKIDLDTKNGSKARFPTSIVVNTKRKSILHADFTVKEFTLYR